jgi:hypothetical protein
VHERLARAVAGDAEDRHGRFLPARSAVGDVEMPVGAEHRVVDLMQSRREQGADARVEGRARQPRNLHRRFAAVKARRDDDRHAIGRGKRHTCRHAADGHEIGG